MIGAFNDSNRLENLSSMLFLFGVLSRMSRGWQDDLSHQYRHHRKLVELSGRKLIENRVVDKPYTMEWSSPVVEDAGLIAELLGGFAADMIHLCAKFSQLEKITFTSNSFGWAGCKHNALVLQTPNISFRDWTCLIRNRNRWRGPDPGVECGEKAGELGGNLLSRLLHLASHL